MLKSKRIGAASVMKDFVIGTLVLIGLCLVNNKSFDLFIMKRTVEEQHERYKLLSRRDVIHGH